jgi:hypothetical protein
MVDGSSEAVQGIPYNTESPSGLQGCSELGLSSRKQPSQHWRRIQDRNTQKTKLEQEKKPTPIPSSEAIRRKRKYSYEALEILHRENIDIYWLLLVITQQ